MFMLSFLLAHWRVFAFLGGVGVSTGLAGCQAPPEVVINCDFEGFEGWTTLPPSLTTEQAHSGQHAIKIEQSREYTPVYSQKLGGVLPHAPRHLRLHAWAYLPDGRIRGSVLVVQVLRQGRGRDVWQGLNLDQVVKRYAKWEPVQHTIELPPGLNPNDSFLIYIWHREPGTAFYLDDFQLEAWP